MSDVSKKPGSRVVLSCSGASNMGQIANAMAVRLQQSGIAEMICMTAVGAGQTSHTKNVKKADEVIMINGCKKACGTRILDSLELPNSRHYIVQDLLPELEKDKNYEKVDESVNTLWNDFVEQL